MKTETDNKNISKFYIKYAQYSNLICFKMKEKKKKKILTRERAKVHSMKYGGNVQCYSTILHFHKDITGRTDTSCSAVKHLV